MGKTAVILLNLGAPDSLDSVEPFLFNLFSDPSILSFKAPQFLRSFIAKMIAKRRAPIARHIYETLGGKSPLYENTVVQQNALKNALGPDYDVHIVMRYWHPRAPVLIDLFKKNPPDRIVLLPLYPQFSTTTTQSSITEWMHLQQSAGLKMPVHYACCYPESHGFIKAQAQLVKMALDTFNNPQAFRILFSAHGLPQRIVDAGDPYTRQVDATAQAIMALVNQPNLDWRVCYQSRVGPVSWVKPYADKEIEQAGRENKGVILVPLSFVSEHSETLVELDIEFKSLAEESGVPFYHRVPTVGSHPEFIDALKEQVFKAVHDTPFDASTKILCKKRLRGECEGVCYV